MAKKPVVVAARSTAGRRRAGLVWGPDPVLLEGALLESMSDAQYAGLLADKNLVVVTPSESKKIKKAGPDSADKAPDSPPVAADAPTGKE